MNRARALCVLVTLWAAVADGAETIELKTGQRIEGALKQASPSGITIEVGGQTITFDADKVRAIYFGAPPQPAATTPSAFDSRPAVEALKALQALQSVTRAGVSHREYSTRVLDAKVQVDRFLALPAAPEEAQGRDAIRRAMALYVLASNAWSARITTGPFDRIGIDPAIDDCPIIKQLVIQARREPSRYGTPENDMAAITVAASAPQVIWSCAADKISAAERFLPPEPRSPIAQPSSSACPPGFALDAALKTCVRQ